jgi:hypothetical protein
LAAVRAAIETATKRLGRLMAAREDKIEAEFLPVWREHLAKAISLVDGLLELARERHALIDHWAERTGIRPQPIGSRELDEMLGCVDVFDRDRVVSDTVCGALLAAAARAGVR